MATGEEMTSRALGYFSIGLGVAQIVAPRALTELIGIKPGSASQVTMRVLGLREMSAGLGILTQRQAAGWLWARVAGDVMDIALLGNALLSDDNHRGRLTAALAAVGGVAAADFQSAQQLSHAGEPISFTKAITVNRKPEDVYRFWRDFRNFPNFMSHLEAVTITSEKISHWRAAGPAGRSVEWDAEMSEDRPNQLIAWRSLPGADVENSGTVRFAAAPGERGTDVRVEMRYTPPGGGLGATIARLFGQEPRQQVQADLRKLKQVLETGEVVRSSATLHGTHLFQAPAQPPSEQVNSNGSGAAPQAWASVGRTA